MWLYESFQDFSREAAGGTAVERRAIASGDTTWLQPAGTNGPPVIVAAAGEIPQGYPILEGRHRQTLPQVPGRVRGRLLAEAAKSGEPSDQKLDAWLLPWRAGVDRTMAVTVKPGTVLVMKIEEWPGPGGKRNRILRRAANFLDAASGAFSTQPSIRAAYERLEQVWDDTDLEKGDPQGDLLDKHAKQLRGVLDDLGTRPRAVLQTEHRMLKLQTVRRTDAKTLRWLSAQPGRNTAERAGARQRIKAPKRYETIATPENRVLRAFAALTVRETKNWLADPGTGSTRPVIEAHQLRARRVEILLRERGVPEAIPSVRPNFALRFDPRYKKIWRAWRELIERSSVTELQWMWQHRTFMELLGLRAAMKLHQAARDRRDGGVLAHAPVLRTKHSPNQGRYLVDAGIRATFGIIRSGAARAVEYESGDDGVRPLGAIASAGPGIEIWWDSQDLRTGSDGSVGGLPWASDHGWDPGLDRWAAKVTT